VNEKDTMKKLLLTLMLAVMSSSAMAEWVEIAEGAGVAEGGNGTIVYVDPTTTRKSGTQAVKMWILFDHKKATKKPPDPVWSEKSQYMFDCKEEKLKALYGVLYAENMGAGRITGKFEDQGWAPIIPGSQGEIMWQYACGK